MTMLKYLTLSIIILFSFLSTSFSQVSIGWVNRYDGGFGDDSGEAISVDDSGFVYVTGNSYGTQTRKDLVVLKYSSAGISKWVRREVISRYGSDIAVDKFYNVFVAGDGLFKYDKDGNLLWSSPVNGAFYSIAVDDTGNAYVSGSMNGGFFFITKKFSPTGNIQWERTYNNLDYNVVRDLVLDKSGNVLITGQSSQKGIFYDFVTIKYSNNGDQLWLRRYDAGNDDIPYGIATDDSNNVYVTGWNRNATTDALTIKYSPEGDSIWKAIYDGGGGDVGYDIVVDSLGCVYIGGITFSSDYLTLKYDNRGNLMWSKVQPGYQIGPQHPVVKIDKDRNVYMSYVSRPSGNNYNYAIVKYDNVGNQKWIADYNNGGSSFNYVKDFVLDKDAKIYVTGESIGGHGYSIATVKFIQDPTSITPIPNIIPKNFYLDQNFPNPFNPVTHLGFGISKLGFVSLKVYDALGKEVAALVNEQKSPGSYEVEFDGSDLPSGIYFYSLQIEGKIVQTKSMVLLK